MKVAILLASSGFIFSNTATAQVLTQTPTGVSIATQSSVSQPIIAQPVAAQPAAAATWSLPSNTELTITPNSDLSSKSLKEGDTFSFSTVYDVLMSNYIVLPKGTRGQGHVTWRTGKGAFGKSAKMDLAFDWIDIGGRRVTVEGKHRQEGEGNTAATVGTVVAVGPFAAFVTGKSATVPRGMQLKAFTTEPILFQPATLAPAPQQAVVMPVSAAPGAVAVGQGTSPAVSAVSSGDRSQ